MISAGHPVQNVVLLFSDETQIYQERCVDPADCARIADRLWKIFVGA